MYVWGTCDSYKYIEMFITGNKITNPCANKFSWFYSSSLDSIFRFYNNNSVWSKCVFIGFLLYFANSISWCTTDNQFQEKGKTRNWHSDSIQKESGREIPQLEGGHLPSWLDIRSARPISRRHLGPKVFVQSRFHKIQHKPMFKDLTDSVIYEVL